MKNILQKLKRKIFNWLFLEEFKKQVYQVERIKVEVNTIFLAIEHLLIASHKSQEKSKEIYDKIKTIFKSMDIGVSVDIAHGDSSTSWAVFSIQGKQHDFVKFVDLPEKDLRQIISFVEHFDKNRIKADVPLSLKHLFKI